MDFSNALPPNNHNRKPAGIRPANAAPLPVGDPPRSGLAAFDVVQPAPAFSPLPPGIYVARVERGEYTTTRAGSEAYRIRFEVTDGAHAGKTVARTWTFSEKALSYTKRDLAAFGLTTHTQLLSTFPEPGKIYRVRLVVALKRGEDGVERNDIKSITIVGVDESPVSRFMLPPTPSEGGQG